MCWERGIGRHFVWNECFFKLDHFSAFFFVSHAVSHTVWISSPFVGWRAFPVSTYLCFSQWHCSLFVNLNYLVALRTWHECANKIDTDGEWWMEVGGEICRSYVETPASTRVLCATRPFTHFNIRGNQCGARVFVCVRVAALVLAANAHNFAQLTIKLPHFFLSTLVLWIGINQLMATIYWFCNLRFVEFD